MFLMDEVLGKMKTDYPIYIGSKRIDKPTMPTVQPYPWTTQPNTQPSPPYVYTQLTLTPKQQYILKLTAELIGQGLSVSDATIKAVESANIVFDVKPQTVNVVDSITKAVKETVITGL